MHENSADTENFCEDGVKIAVRNGVRKMGFAPSKCPMCNSTQWKKIDTSKSGFSVGKAAVGGVLLGPVGLLGGALGKKKVCYACAKCGFQHEYNG